MIVISTTGAAPPTKAKCLASVDPALARHIYLELPERPSSGFPHFPALIDTIAPLPDDEIVISLDGDDWLTPGALERVQCVHDAGALVTYGSFMYADGRPASWVRPLAGPPRKNPWVTTHLKTFRAGLFKRIRHKDLQDERGKWLEHARDHALMFPLVEMAGPGRVVFIPDILCVYNYASSDEHTKGASFVCREIVAAERLRRLPSYQPLP